MGEEATIFCYNCNRNPLNGAIENDEGELKCTECGEFGFIELIDSAGAFTSSIIDSSQQNHPNALPSASSSSSSSFPHDAPFPTVVMAPSRTVSPTFSSQSTSARTSVPPHRYSHPHPIVSQLHSHPSDINWIDGFHPSTIETGFRVSFPSPNEARLTPGVSLHLLPSFEPTPFGSIPLVQSQRQPVGFTATVNNVDPTQFMNSLFEGIGQFADVAGLDHVIQFIMENDTNRFGSPPASAAVVAALPEETLTEDTTIGDCAICQEDFKVGDKVKHLSPNLSVCPHMFHVSCVTPWLAEHNSCPVCRFELATDNPDYERRRLQRQTVREPQMQQPTITNNQTLPQAQIPQLQTPFVLFGPNPVFNSNTSNSSTTAATENAPDNST